MGLKIIGQRPPSVRYHGLNRAGFLVLNYPEYDQSALVNLEVEEALIGAMMIDPKAAIEAISIVTPEDFYHDPFPAIVESCIALHDDGMQITALTVKARLGGSLDEIGGVEYLKSLARSAPALANTKALAQIVIDLAQRRRADAELEAARSRVLRVDRPLVECLANVTQLTSDVIERSMRQKSHLALPDVVDAELRAIEAAMNGEAPPAIFSGLPRLDDLTGGFRAGNLVVVGGRPGGGKSVLLANVARTAAQALDSFRLQRQKFPNAFDDLFTRRCSRSTSFGRICTC